MSYSKVIPVGSAGSLTISEAAGQASVKVSLNEQAGGGEIAGFAKAQLSAEIDVNALVLADVGLEIIAAKYPAASSLILSIKAIMDGEASKV